MFKFKTFDFKKLIALMLLQLLFSSCEKPPTDTVIKGERLIEEAKKAEADVYAKDIFPKAEKTLKATKEHVAAKEYKEAKASAMEAAQLAQEAITIAKAEKTKLNEEAELMAQEIDTLLGEMRRYSEKLKSKQSKSKTNELQSLIERIQSELSSSKGRLQRQEILQAHTELKVLRDKVSNLKETISQDRKKSQR